jgi:sulfur-carrier protein
MAQVTNITVRIPGALRASCGGVSELEIPAANVRAVFEQLEQRHPELHRSLCDETGAVRRHIGVFVNRSHVREQRGLDTALVAGDVVTILPAVSGG